MYALAAPPCPAPLQLVLTQNCAFQVLKPADKRSKLSARSDKK